MGLNRFDSCELILVFVSGLVLTVTRTNAKTAKISVSKKAKVLQFPVARTRPVYAGAALAA
jgi:hypothetical protein